MCPDTNSCQNFLNASYAILRPGINHPLQQSLGVATRSPSEVWKNLRIESRVVHDLISISIDQKHFVLGLTDPVSHLGRCGIAILLVKRNSEGALVFDDFSFLVIRKFC